MSGDTMWEMPPIHNHSHHPPNHQHHPPPPHNSLSDPLGTYVYDYVTIAIF